MAKAKTFKCSICKKVKSYSENKPKDDCQRICDYCQENDCKLLTKEDIKNLKKIVKNIKAEDLERLEE